MRLRDAILHYATYSMSDDLIEQKGDYVINVGDTRMDLFNAVDAIRNMPMIDQHQYHPVIMQILFLLKDVSLSQALELDSVDQIHITDGSNHSVVKIQRSKLHTRCLVIPLNFEVISASDIPLTTQQRKEAETTQNKLALAAAGLLICGITMIAGIST